MTDQPPSSTKGLIVAVVLIVLGAAAAGAWAVKKQASAVAAGGLADLGPDAVTTPSGLRYKDFQIGNGPSPRKGQTVVVHYHGRLPDGSVFDSSRQRGQVFEFVIGEGQVIKGWDEGVLSMKVGGVRRLVCPPDLAYGSAGSPPKIPPDATLVFDVELLGLK